jgi:hypothetical protein
VHLATILEFILASYILIMILECALGYRSWLDTLVTLRQLSDLSFMTPVTRDRSLTIARCRCRLW